ncbi:2735_t:CDS:2, partial [Acaulospora colombiana]
AAENEHFGRSSEEEKALVVLKSLKAVQPCLSSLAHRRSGPGTPLVHRHCNRPLGPTPRVKSNPYSFAGVIFKYNSSNNLENPEDNDQRWTLHSPRGADEAHNGPHSRKSTRVIAWAQVQCCLSSIKRVDFGPLGKSTVENVDNFSVTVNVTNTGDETLKLYQDPRGALSTFPENTFKIAAIDGEDTPNFAGARVKYGFSVATNFVTLEPGASVVVSHDLSKAYEFAKVGDYNIEAHNLFYYQDASGSPVPLRANVDSTYTAKLSGNLVSTSLSKRRAEGVEKRAESNTLYRRGGRLQKRQTYTGCSSEQKKAIDRAVPIAVNYVDRSIQYLRTLVSGKPRFESWFGAYRRDRHTVVSGHFNLIKQDNPTTYNYDCRCLEFAGTENAD